MSWCLIRTFMAAIVTGCTFSSCGFGTYIDPSNVPVNVQKQNVYYIPSSSNIPALHKKDDLTIGVNSSFASKMERTELYAAYAPTQQLGLFASYGAGSRDAKVALTEVSLALGYIKPFSSIWQFETYGGLDVGNIKNTHYTGSSKINITRLFVQPSLSVHNLKNTIEFAFVSRFTTAGIKIADTTFNQSGESFSADQFKKIASSPNHLLVEPGLMLRFGWPKFLFNFNYTTSAIIAGENFYRSTNCYSLGVVARFNVAKKQSRTAPKVSSDNK